MKAAERNTDIAKIMTVNLFSITSDTDISVIQSIFNEKSFHHLLVEDEFGVLEGIISKEDILKSFEFDNSASSPKAHDIMTAHTITLKMGDTVQEAINCMVDNQIRALPVIDTENKLTGILTTSDIIKFLSDESGYPIHYTPDEISDGEENHVFISKNWSSENYI